MCRDNWLPKVVYNRPEIGNSKQSGPFTKYLAIKKEFFERYMRGKILVNLFYNNKSPSILISKSDVILFGGVKNNCLVPMSKKIGKSFFSLDLTYFDKVHIFYEGHTILTISPRYSLKKKWWSLSIFIGLLINHEL